MPSYETSENDFEAIMKPENSVSVSKSSTTSSYVEANGEIQHKLKQLQLKQKNGTDEQIRFLSSFCCVPTGCNRQSNDPIALVSYGETIRPVGTQAVRVVCSSTKCTVGQWIHSECFSDWELRLLGWIKACGRTYGLSDRQLLENLWVSPIYDLIYQATMCSCGKGRLRKDLSCLQAQMSDVSISGGLDSQSLSRVIGQNLDDPLLKANRISDSSYQSQIYTRDAIRRGSLNPAVLQKAREMKLQREALAHQAANQSNFRLRAFSYSSTGSSPPSSGTYSPPPSPPKELGLDVTGTSPTSYQHLREWLHQQGLSNSPPPHHQSGAAFPHNWSPAHRARAHTVSVVSTTSSRPSLPPLQLGNMFHHRSNLTAFRVLPVTARNTYHIRVEDEGPHGNDQTRGFVLKNLTRARITKVSCVVCARDLPIFDEFPLIDGTFFLSPKRYNSDMVVTFSGADMFLNAVCLSCLEGSTGGVKLTCGGCQTPWSGESLMVGTMYSYDVFAAMACCTSRLGCTGCGKPVTDAPPKFFSDCSRPLNCPHCGKTDYHFTKPLASVYQLQKIS